MGEEKVVRVGKEQGDLAYDKGVNINGAHKGLMENGGGDGFELVGLARGVDSEVNAMPFLFNIGVNHQVPPNKGVKKFRRVRREGVNVEGNTDAGQEDATCGKRKDKMDIDGEEDGGKRTKQTSCVRSVQVAEVGVAQPREQQ